MSKIENAYGCDDYKLLIEFDDGSIIIYNMQKMVRTLPYIQLKDLSNFRTVKFDEKSVYWDMRDHKSEYFPLRISVDQILFSLRD